MADSEFVIGGSVIFDTTQLKTGTTDAASTLDRLASDVDSTATEVNSSFTTMGTGITSTLGQSGTFDQNVSYVNTSGRRLKAVGGEIGSAFAGNLNSGIQSGDVVGTVTNIFAGLSALPGIGAVGVGIGAALVGGIVARTKAASAAMAAAVDEAFSEIETKAKDTNASILAAYEETLSFQNTLEEAGGGSASEGFARLSRAADAIGVELEDVVQVIQGKMSPEAQNVREIMQKILDDQKDTGDVLEDNSGILAVQKKFVDDILGLEKDTTNTRDRALEMLESQRDYQLDTRTLTREIRQDMSDAGYSSKEIADAWERVYNAIQNVSRELPSISDLWGR